MAILINVLLRGSINVISLESNQIAVLQLMQVATNFLKNNDHEFDY